MACAGGIEAEFWGSFAGPFDFKIDKEALDRHDVPDDLILLKREQLSVTETLTWSDVGKMKLADNPEQRLRQNQPKYGHCQLSTS